MLLKRRMASAYTKCYAGDRAMHYTMGAHRYHMNLRTARRCILERAGGEYKITTGNHTVGVAGAFAPENRNQ